MYSIQCEMRANRRKVLSMGLSVAFFLCILGHPGLAQQELGSSPPAANSPQWVVGPATASIGSTADIAVPEGCRFTDQNFARVVLANSRQPIPENLVGLLFPDSHRWFAVIQFTEMGYVKVGDKESLDADDILNKYQADIAVQSREHSLMGSRAAVPDLSWELKPVYDPAQNKLEYAMRAKSGIGGSINYVVNWLGRRGMLNVTIVMSDQSAFDLASLRDAVKGVTFKKGERYADFQPQDRVAHSSLAELILNSDGAPPLSRLARLARNKFVWAGAAAFLLVGGVGLTVLTLKRRKVRYYRMEDKRRRAAVSQPAATNGHAVNGNGQPQVQLANGQTALRPNGGGFQRNGHRRRKKRFSYHAFYSDMVMNLTRCNYVGSPGGFLHGQSTQLDSSAPQEIGHTPAMPDTANLLVAETSKLIQSQQKLIEGQRKLIEEQSKLIQEKSMLIEAETRVMGKQSEMLAEQQLM